MKSKFLFPTWCSIVGFVLIIPGFMLAYFYTFHNYEIPGFGFQMREKSNLFQDTFENFTNELIVFLIIIGLLLIAFSKSKKEDELTARLRLNSLYWSVMIYYICYNFCFLLLNYIKEIPFIGEHILELNIFSPLVIFIIRYYYLKYSKADSFIVSEPKFLPNKPFRIVGVVLTLIGMVVFLSLVSDNLIFGSDDLLFVISYFVMITGLLIWSFSKSKIEDEMVMQQRLESLQLAVYINYGVLLVGTLVFYSTLYLVMMMYVQFSLLLYFVVRMEYVRFRNNKQLNALAEEMGYEK